MTQNILFICSRNKWRSPTAEVVFRKHPALNVRSAGTSPGARRKVTEADLAWAHTIFVMEAQHRRQLQRKFGAALDGKRLINLDIPDVYQFMAPELVDLLTESVQLAIEIDGGGTSFAEYQRSVND